MKLARLTFYLLAFAGILPSVQGQVFWSETFTDETASLTNWVSGGSPSGAAWEWSTDPGYLTFGSQPDFLSATSATGYMVFDSDGLGEVDHVVTLTSPAINCAGQASVFIQLFSQYGSYSGNDIAEIGTSTDGVNFTYHEILDDVPNNNLSLSFSETNLELPELANQPVAYIQFRWTGNYEYAWKIDDISLSNQSQLAAVSLKVLDFFFPAASFATPVSQIATDSMGFSLIVRNEGSETQNNVEVKVEVLDENNNVLHLQEAIIASLAPGSNDTLDNEDFPILYAPELDEGTYTIQYSVIPEEPDATPSDNIEAHDFVVTADLFANEAGPTTALGWDSDFAYGCNYRMSPLSADNFVAKEGLMSMATNTGDPLVGKSVDVFLLKVVDPLYFQTNDFPPNNPGLEIVGANTYVVPAGTVNFADLTVPIIDFNTSSNEISLEPGVTYIIIAYYSGDNNTAFHGFSSETAYMDGGTVLYFPTGDNPGWFGGWTSGQQCQLRMPLYLATRTDNPALEASLTLFPNPVSEVLNAEVRFEQPEDGMIIIANAEGKVVTYREFSGVTDQNFTFNVSKYAAGNYVVRISNSQGVKTLPFVVTGQ